MFYQIYTVLQGGRLVPAVDYEDLNQQLGEYRGH